MDNWFGINKGLAAAGRLPVLARTRDRISVYEILWLIFCGAVAAAGIGLVRLGLRIPGHSIILSMMPMVLGLALAPRRLSGFIMSASAFGTGALLNVTGLAQIGAGAFVSLCLIGPMMDLAVSKFRSGWKLYSGLILAGLCTNLMALFSRSASKLLGLDPGTRPFGGWWTQALLTYALSGALAGLIGAICFFHVRKQRSKSETDDAGNPR
ncbi:MAG TPA: hypothetical protein VMG30_06795 [Acidobacteriota bacterium]|nr:hypothetical protein [Acidobacteriota bacterium]